MVDGLDVESRSREELEQWAKLAREARAEVWITANAPGERIEGIPAALRALKGHGNPDVAALHVALDPKTLLLLR